MLSRRTGLAALTLAMALAGTFAVDEAAAKGRCASGQILKVSSGTCISRASAVQQGILGSRHASRVAHRSDADVPAADAVAATMPAEQAPAPAPETTSVARTAAAAPVDSSATLVASAAPAGVRVEMVKTEPRPTPAILTPTWPYGELAAFPHRSEN
jgi:hypothetical protein